jgi:hypothetical protein
MIMRKLFFFSTCAALLAGTAFATAQDAVVVSPLGPPAPGAAVDNPPDGATPAAVVAPKPAARHHQTKTKHQQDAKTIQQQLPQGTYLRIGPARSPGSVDEPSYMRLQDIGIDENLGG